MEKALNRIWDDSLLHKLVQMGTSTNIVVIIKSFLQNRTFKIRQEEILSTRRPALARMPQGLCLSPKLYAVYTNHMEINTNANLALFADDTLLYVKNKNYKRAIINLQKQQNITV